MCTCNLYQIKFISVYFFFVRTSSASAHFPVASLTQCVGSCSLPVWEVKHTCAHRMLFSLGNISHLELLDFLSCGFSLYALPLFSYNCHLLIILINFKANPNHSIIYLYFSIHLFKKDFKNTIIPDDPNFLLWNIYQKCPFKKNFESGSKQPTHCNWLLCLFSPLWCFLI